MVPLHVKICSKQDKYHKCLTGLKYCCVDWTYHSYRTSGDQRCTFLCSSGCNFQCLLLQIKFCTLSHILTLVHHQYIYKTVSSMTDYFTLAQHIFCTLNSCYYGTGSYISDISETMMWLWIWNYVENAECNF
jgi:hypothetical protein